MSQGQSNFLPHRRQRPLSHTTYEYAVLEHRSAPAGFKLSFGPRFIAIALGIIAGLSTVGTGAMVLPWDLDESSPRVAGAQTTQAYDELTPDEIQSLSSVCWNQVSEIEGKLYWQDSCRGLIPNDARTCLPRPLPLAESEIVAYNAWYEADQVLAAECQAKPQDIPKTNPLER